MILRLIYEGVLAEAQNGGRKIPIWGTCLGLEMLSILISGDEVRVGINQP